MNGIAGIHRFVVDGDDAARLYEILSKSYFIENNCTPQPYEGCNVQVELSFYDRILRIEEKTTGEISYMADILCFFVGRDHMFCMSEYIKDGVVLSYTVEDPEGRYFVRPPMTEWELQEEERMQQRMNRSDDDLPF